MKIMQDLERIANQLVSSQLDAGKDAARDSLVDELIRRQGIDPEDADTQTKEIANQAVLKIIMPYNFSGKDIPEEGFWRRADNFALLWRSRQ